MINRYELVNRHNPVLTKADKSSPLSVGNGNFAFTADITGMQTLYEEYQTTLPLCTMAQWAWHTKPVSEKRYSYALSDVEMTEYPYEGRTVQYAVKKKNGNEEAYDWVRQNPHKLNLARISFAYQGNPITEDQITDIYQELKLYEGIMDSRFQISGESCHVITASDCDTDTVSFQVKSMALEKGLSVFISFPYGNHGISASDWDMKS
ncbi:MAG: hypothetical protein K0R23_2675, partial [Lacrimispora sp.]|nr:hypothetical protein [Lacrimispora sp.]